MRKLSFLSLLAICSLGLFGCPYESQVPISKPYIPVENDLLGKWTSNDEVYNSYTVTKASATEYRIVQKNISKVSTYKGHLSEIRGNVFMNVYSDSTKVYYLYKIKLDPAGDKLTLIPVSDNVPEHFGSIDGLRHYLEKNMNFQSFYNEKDKADYKKAEAGTSTALN